MRSNSSPSATEPQTGQARPCFARRGCQLPPRPRHNRLLGHHGVSAVSMQPRVRPEMQSRTFSNTLRCSAPDDHCIMLGRKIAKIFCHFPPPHDNSVLRRLLLSAEQKDCEPSSSSLTKIEIRLGGNRLRSMAHAGSASGYCQAGKPFMCIEANLSPRRP